MPRDRKRAEEAGFFRYLTKPVDVDELVGAIEEVLAGQDVRHARMILRSRCGGARRGSVPSRNRGTRGARRRARKGCGGQGRIPPVLHWVTAWLRATLRP